MTTWNKILAITLLLISPSIMAEEEVVSITSFWNKEKQQIDGFGIAQAGWADQLFLFQNRHQVLNAMFGDNGLRLNILRGEIFPHYSTERNSTDFSLLQDTIIPASYNEETDKDVLRRGQFWLTQAAAKEYHVDKLIFSTWSPPAWMKSNLNVSGGKLEKKNYQLFADYLVDFYEAYQSAGIPVYAISPSNEPGYAAPWNSCLWTADEMGEFAAEYLGPTFAKRNVKAKMLLGENPLWSVVLPVLASSSSFDFVQTIVTKYPKVLTYNPIFAGHGYTLPDTIKQLPPEMLQTPIVPLLKNNTNESIPTWVTEISDITPLDISMEDGLKWAKTFHEYLSTANVHAIIWWAGAQPTSNNESLIILDKDRVNFSLAKRYYTFGNYSRYIPTGSRRVETSCSQAGLSVTSYKHDNTCIWVIINETSNDTKLSLSIDNNKRISQLNGYYTNEKDKWVEKQEKADKGNGLVTIPAQSVVTYIGKVM